MRKFTVAMGFVGVALAACTTTADAPAPATSAPASAAAPAEAAVTMSDAVGVYDMVWRNGQTGVYEVLAVTDAGAQVSYSYGDRTETDILPIRGNRIVGGGWFPTLTVRDDGSVRSSHSGSTARVSKR